MVQGMGPHLVARFGDQLRDISVLPGAVAGEEKSPLHTLLFEQFNKPGGAMLNPLIKGRKAPHIGFHINTD
jgi:hypothetical protein